MKAVELFAGAGGLAMGVSKAGFHPVEIVEWDRWCCDTINQNRMKGISPVEHWPEPHHGDVRPRCFKDLGGKVELVSGGPPCQPFSLGGKHRAFDDSRDMWPQAVRAVREIRPKAFIFENVKGLRV
jgi:DNA (cytosine-5)-methyltransferase 1